MRVLVKDGYPPFEVEQFWMTKNMWEFFLAKGGSTMTPAIVWGDALEMGDVCISEIEPFKLISTSDLRGIQPPPGWQWED